MECVSAQQAISDALDGQPVERAVLSAAQDHCRRCADCARFVRGQLLLKQAQLPAVPPDLMQRVKEVAARAVAERLASASAAVQADAEPQPSPDADAAPHSPEASPAIGPDAAGGVASTATLIAEKPSLADRLDKHTPLLVGISLAIIAVSATVALAVFGTRQITGQNQPPNLATIPSAQAPQASAPTTGSAGGSGAPGGASSSAEATQAGPKYVTVNGTVYSLVGPSSNGAGATRVIGITTTALGSPQGSRGRDVSGGQNADTAYITDDSGQVLEFRRVTRSYLGLTYVLTSKELTDYGQWPTLPNDMALPTTPDGSPAFLFSGTDSSGVKLYRKTTQPVTSGFAIAPQGDTGSSLSADPYWTWWAQASQ